MSRTILIGARQADWNWICDLYADDVVWMHEAEDGPLMAPAEIARRLHLRPEQVSRILTEWHAGRQAYGEAYRLMEGPPTRRRVVHLEATGCVLSLQAGPGAAGERRAA